MLVAALTACGSSSDSSGDSTSTNGGAVSTTEYEKALESTCGQAKATVEALPPFPNVDIHHPDPAQLAPIGRYFERNTLKAYALIIASFEKLQPPASEKQALNAFIARLKAQVVVAHRQIDAAKKSDVAAFVATFAHVDASVTKLKAAEAGLGVPLCAGII